MALFKLPACGGSLMLAWQLKNKTVLIVGGGEVASGRIESVLAADAFITLISPSEGLHPLTRKFIDHSDRITHHDRVFQGQEDLTGIDMVLTAIDDIACSQKICDMCRELKVPVNVADIPPSCDFYFGSQIRRGPLQVMISTNGNGPKLANIIRKRVEKSLPENVGEAIEKVGALRAKLRERAPGVGGDLGKKRMRWMISVCDSWSMDDLAELDDTMMDKLLDIGWEKDRIPGPEEVGASSRKPINFLLPSALVPGTIGCLVGVAATTALFMFRLR